MSEPRHLHDAEPAALEPWALALLDRDGDANPATRDELSRVVALLRELPDLESSPGLTARILERIAEQRSRPSVVHVVFDAARRATSPHLGLALAAGVAGLLLWSAPGNLPSGLSGSSPSSALRDGTPGHRVPRVPQATLADGRGLEASRPAPTRRPSAAVVRPQYVSLYAPAPPSSRVGFDRASIDEAFDRRLDHLLNQLMLDPTAFAQRLERVSERDRFITRLAERAAQRGDAPEIALRVRESRHPLSRHLVDRLLSATLVARAPRR